MKCEDLFKKFNHKIKCNKSLEMKCVLVFIIVIFSKREVDGVTDLARLDKNIMEVYENPCKSNIQTLLDNIQLYVTTLRRFNQMVKKGCSETTEEASQLVHSGGPKFLKINAFYSDDEQVFRHKMNFTDYVFQEYQYYRLDSENEWGELKDQIAHVDRDKEKQKELDD